MLETDVLDCSPAALAADWPEPTDLPELETPDNEFPIDALGHILGNAVRAAENANQAPLALNGQTFLAAANYSVQAHANIVRGDAVYPVSEFFLTIGKSGERKSTCDRMALKPLAVYSAELAAQYEIDKAIYDRKNTVWEAAQKSIIRKKVKRDQIDQELSELGDRPKAPLVPILKCEEPTMEGLYKNLLHGHPSQALFTDEAGQFIGGSAMNKDNKLRGIATMSKYWDGDPQVRVRQSEEASILRGRRLSVHLLVQPGVAPDFFCDELIKSQGFIARFLAARPKTKIGERPYREVDLSQDQAYKVYFSLMESHLRTPVPLARGTRNELAPRGLALDEAGKARWITFHDLVEREMQPRGRFSGMIEFGSKAAEHCLRLAATLALFENLHASSISAEHIDRAAALMEFYLAEWLCLTGGFMPGGDESLAQKLKEWLEAKKLDIVTATDISGGGPSCLRVGGAAKRAIDCLVEYGWLKPAPSNVMVRGRKRREAFWVHPKILS